MDLNDKNKQIEKSIIKTYKKDIWSKFIKAVKDFKLVEENDKIAVCISGGKDSFILAKCMQELKRHGKINFEIVFICMNPGYNTLNLEKIKNNAKLMNINLEIFETNIFNVVSNQKTSPCYLCARMRRGYLYSKAKELGCNKIALGHHMDDVVETILLSTFYASDYKTMLPILDSTNFKGMKLIRPLYYVRETSIINWQKYNSLSFINCACKLTNSKEYMDKNKRKEIKELLNLLRKTNPNIDYNVLKSTFNVNLDTLIGYTKEGKYHYFLD